MVEFALSILGPDIHGLYPDSSTYLRIQVPIWGSKEAGALSG